MPIYEFSCRACGRRTTALVMVRDRAHEVRCAACGGADLERLWSRFATVKSDEARLERLADSAAGIDENDPASVERWTRQMAASLGDEAGADLGAALEDDASGGAADDGPDLSE